MTRPPTDKPIESTPDSTPRDPLARRRILLRVAAGVVAAALLVTLAVLVLGGRTTARSPEAYCSRMGDTRDLGDVLATGDADQIESAVRQLEAAGKVAPVEIQPAMDLYVSYATPLREAVATTGTDEASIAAALKAATIAQNEQADQVAAAVTQVDAYVTSTCGFALTPATGVTTTPSGG